MDTKTCTKCGEEKPLDEFYCRENSPDVRRKDCKVCCRKRAAAYAKANPEKVKATRKAWEDKNKEHLRARRRQRSLERKEYVRAYRRANKEKVQQWRRNFRKRHGDRIRAEARAKYHENPELINKARRAYLDRKLGPERVAELKRMRTPEYRAESKKQQRIKSNLFKKRRVQLLSDEYVKCLLEGVGVKSPPQELVELKRVQIKVYRELKQRATK